MNGYAPKRIGYKHDGYVAGMEAAYAGGFLHADDIRTLATSADSLSAQVSLVKSFAEENFLKLNVQKCKFVVSDRGRRYGDHPVRLISGKGSV